MTNIRPTDVPELRAELVAHLKGERGRMQLERFEGNRLAAGPNVVGNITAEDMRGDEVERLRKAELFFVSSEMTQLAIEAGKSLPFFSLEPEDLPADHGFMIFAEPFATYSNEGKPDANVHACCWEVMDGHSIWMSFYSNWHTWLHDCRLAGTFQKDHLDYCLIHDHWLFLETFVFSPLAKRREAEGPWAEDAREIAAVENVVRAAWLLMQQPLAATDVVEPDRAVRKRLRRMDEEPKPVRVIQLRRPKSSGAGDGSRDYHHQWIVRGHWRQQWYPARQVHRPVWIAPHIKGPEGAPMIGGEKVYAWKR